MGYLCRPRFMLCRYRATVFVWVVTIVGVYIGFIFVAHLNSKTSDNIMPVQSLHTTSRKTNRRSITPIKRAATTPKDLIQKCEPTLHQNFPLCISKLQYLKLAWMLPCFKDAHGVTNNQCSMLQYLSEVEHFCPILPQRQGLVSEKKPEQIDETAIRLDPADLLKELSNPGFGWLRMRVGQMWGGWKEAGQRLMKQNYMKKREKKKVLFFLGSMSFQPWMLRWAGHGGPLGELVQWTDVISGVYLLGHDIKVVLDDADLSKVLEHADPHNCIPKQMDKAKQFDVIFTDINGMGMVGRALGLSIQSLLRCKFRLLDSFGTQAEFNNNAYPGKISGGRSGWGNQDLLLKQFMTLFPHTPDNSFLGFVAGSNHRELNTVRKNRALVYGKLSSYFSGLKDYFDIIHEYFEIHATAVDVGNAIPDYVINHGSVDLKTIYKLLKEAKVFIGLGFPYEGPGPLEAALHGTVFINPKFPVPKSKLNDNFFAGKPTLRKVTSQSPYMEDFIPEPYAYTIDINNKTRVREVIQKIAKMEKFVPYLPKEFTHLGFAERVHAFLQYQDFCSSTKTPWPPLTSRQVYVGEVGQTCTDKCKQKGLVCEGSFFDSLNKKEHFTREGIFCLIMHPSGLTHAPSHDPKSNVCYLQAHRLSFSCDGSLDGLQRLCPCRDFIKEQVAICKDCLS